MLCMLCMYVCMYVCYVCMYVMYVCVYICMHVLGRAALVCAVDISVIFFRSAFSLLGYLFGLVWFGWVKLK